MIKRTFTALSAVALLGLTACGDTVEEGDTTLVEGEDTMAEPVDVELPETNVEPMGEGADGMSMSEDGMEAEMEEDSALDAETY